jgi:lipopolysaccharide transport system ATP-binding protein
MTDIIEVNNVSISYREKGHLFSARSHQVFSGLTFDVKRGETLGVLGRNGAGKSTLLKLLANIYKPDVGKIINNSRKTSLLTLSAGFDLNLSGRDNALLSGMLMGYRKKEIETGIDDIYEYSELGEFFDQPLKTYSTGMRGRLGFAVATFMSPEHEKPWTT